jgi:transcription elongation factor GreA
MARELPIVDKLKTELHALRYEFTIELPKIIETAREHGDLRENAEYHAAKERQGIVNARIGQIEERLRELSVYTIASIPADRAGYGSIVAMEDLNSGEKVRYELVFPEETDSARGRISISSPVGQALLKRAEGDEVTIRLPSGQRSYEILSVTTIHERDDF